MKRLFLAILSTVVCTSILISPIRATPQSNLVFSKSSKQEKKVALTFDDGPHPRYTHEILEILAEYDVPATFFVIGINASRYPEALTELARSGCEIGNHTYSHNTLRYASREQIEREISECQNEIRSKTGITPTLFRPPEGRFNQYLEAIALEMDYRIILWSIDTKDWAHTPADVIVKDVLQQLGNGDIILMHDYTSGENSTCRALRALIPAILAKGYEFVTVSELINGDDA